MIYKLSALVLVISQNLVICLSFRGKEILRKNRNEAFLCVQLSLIKQMIIILEEI